MFTNQLLLFRFAAFGAGETTSLRIYRQDYATSPKESDDALNVDEDDASPTVNFLFKDVCNGWDVCMERDHWCT